MWLPDEDLLLFEGVFQQVLTWWKGSWHEYIKGQLFRTGALKQTRPQDYTLLSLDHKQARDHLTFRNITS